MTVRMERKNSTFWLNVRDMENIWKDFMIELFWDMWETISIWLQHRYLSHIILKTKLWLLFENLTHAMILQIVSHFKLSR